MKFVEPNIKKPEIGEFVVVEMPDGRTGICRVLGSAWYTSEEDWSKKPKGELSYSYNYNKPFPQVSVRDACARMINVNGDDILKGELREVSPNEMIYQKFYDLSSLSEILHTIVIDSYEAINDPPCSCCRQWSEKKVTLSDVVLGYHNQVVKETINKMMDTKAVLYSFGEMESPGDSFLWPSAEFVVSIKNTANIYITLDGYSGNSIELKLF